MSDIGDGIDIEYFDDNPPMKFEGTFDGRLSWRLLRFEWDWIFLIARAPELLDDEKQCIYRFQSELGKVEKRPKPGTQMLVEDVKQLVRGAVAKWRESQGPRDWWPKKIRRENHAVHSIERQG